MYSEKIKTIVRSSTSIENALQKMVLQFGDGRLEHLFWGYAVHVHGLARNDALIAHTCEGTELTEAFLAAGGTANDVVANKIGTLKHPFQIDIVQLAEHQRDTKDARLTFTETIIAHDIKTAWICIVDAPWVGGSGVFNQFYKDRLAEPAIPLDDISEIAHTFHEELRRNRLIAKQINLRKIQVEFLSEVAKGRSAEDLADKYQISSRAVEKRLENIRKTLNSRNTLEAVYKATMYGVLPYSATN
ncbi:MAG: hypothetical protein ABJQ34_09155 [Paracoccaceae bacterium]